MTDNQININDEFFIEIKKHKSFNELSELKQEEFKSLLKQNNVIHKSTFIDNIKIDKIPSVVTYANSLFLSLRKDKIFSKTIPAKLQTYMALGRPIISVLNGEGASLIREAGCGFVEENYDYKCKCFDNYKY